MVELIHTIHKDCYNFKYSAINLLYYTTIGGNMFYLLN